MQWRRVGDAASGRREGLGPAVQLDAGRPRLSEEGAGAVRATDRADYLLRSSTISMAATTSTRPWPLSNEVVPAGFCGSGS
jgi:hypothetical protein